MRTITFLFFMTIAIAVSATRIHNVTVAGKTPSVPFTRFTATNNSETAIGDVQSIFPANTDLSNVNVTFLLDPGNVVSEPNPFPTDWSSTATVIKVMNTVGTWAKHKITLKVLKPAPLPIEIKTGPGGNFFSSYWTPDTIGWAGACIDNNSEYIRFGGFGKASFVVAFTDIPDSLIYTLKVLHTEWHTNNIFDVDGSTDGINWTSIKRYDATVAMPTASPAIIVRLKIAPEYRYVRWHYTNRAASNVLLENITVTKLTPTISLTSGNNPASAEATLEMTPVVFTYSDVADDANVLSDWYTDNTYVSTTTAPSGLSISKNTEAKTVTVSGTPTTVGTYYYKVVADETDGNAIEGSVEVGPYLLSNVENIKLKGISFDGMTIRNTNHELIRVLDMSGRIMVTSNKDIEMSAFNRGIYIVRGETGVMKIAL